jgi:hypothetical protein
LHRKRAFKLLHNKEYLKICLVNAYFEAIYVDRSPNFLSYIKRFDVLLFDSVLKNLLNGYPKCKVLNRLHYHERILHNIERMIYFYTATANYNGIYFYYRSRFQQEAQLV